MKNKTKKILKITTFALAIASIVGGLVYMVRVNTKGVDETNNDILGRDSNIYMKVNDKKIFFKKAETEKAMLIANETNLLSSTISEYKEAVHTDFLAKEKAGTLKNYLVLENIHVNKGDYIQMMNKDVNITMTDWCDDCGLNTYLITDGAIKHSALNTEGILSIDSFNSRYKVEKAGKLWIAWSYTEDSDKNIVLDINASQVWFSADPVKAVA